MPEKLKLSQAIRKGKELIDEQQRCYMLTIGCFNDNKHTILACALGAALAGSIGNREGIIKAYNNSGVGALLKNLLENSFPELDNDIRFDETGTDRSTVALSTVIVHWNDNKHLTLDEIADRLEIRGF